MQVAEWFGVRGKGSVHHSEACCTGYVGLEQAVNDVASGAHEIVLSGCVEMACGLPVPGKPAHLRKKITTDDVTPDLEAIMDRAYTRALGEVISDRMTGWISTKMNMACQTAR